jgi:lipid A 3-O-deacylase
LATLRTLAAACALLLVLPPPSRAADSAFVSLSAGLFDALQADDRAGELGLQVRGRGWLWRRRLAPMAGMLTTTDGSLCGYAGLSLDVPLGAHFALRASFGPGAYARGDGKDLYSVFQMRSGLEAGWRFRGGTRLGLELGHISNGSITEYNPGQTTLLLLVSLPFATGGAR